MIEKTARNARTAMIERIGKTERIEKIGRYRSGIGQ